MKKLILLLLTLFICLPVMAQRKRNHKPLRQFDRDTVAYLEANTLLGGENYSGDKIALLIDEMELPVKSVLFEIISFPNFLEVVQINLHFAPSEKILKNHNINKSSPGIGIQIGMGDLEETKRILQPIIKDQRKSFIVDWTPEVEKLVRQITIGSASGGRYNLEALYKEY